MQPSAHDWVYGRYTPLCNASLTYEASIQPTDSLARIFMFIFWSACLAAIYTMPTCTVDQRKVACDRQPRWLFLDVVRIMAVVGVVTEHCGGETYSEHNVGFTANMVLPYLFMVSGISFMMSRSSMYNYFRRLAALLVVGVTCNVIGDIIARPGWYTDLGNTVFQMWYVIFLMAFALLCWPLRSALRDDEHTLSPCSPNAPASVATRAVAFYYGLVWAMFVVVYLAGWQPLLPRTGYDDDRWESHIAPILVNAPWICAHVSGFPALASCHAAFNRTRDGRLPWLLLAYVYVPRILFPMTFALAPQMVFLFLLGLLSQAQPLLGTHAIARYARAYWLILFTFLVLTSMPDLTGRCDLFPPLTVWERLRFDISELVLAVLLLTRTLDCADPLGIFGPLNYWALVAFCTHVMLVRIFASFTPSFAATIEFAFAPIFVLVFKRMGWANLNDGRGSDQSRGGGGSGRGSPIRLARSPSAAALVGSAAERGPSSSSPLAYRGAVSTRSAHMEMDGAEESSASLMGGSARTSEREADSSTPVPAGAASAPYGTFGNAC